MKLQTKRLFINNLPDNITQSDLEKKFSNYGTVASVEIKQRKNIRENQSAQFAYIHIDIETSFLHTCIDEFSNIKWKGHWVEVQEAKESFMDRLKREREQLQVNEPSTSTSILPNNTNIVTKTSSTSIPTFSSNANNTIKNNINVRKYHSSSSESSSSDDEQDSGFNSVEPNQNGLLKSDDLNELVIKNNKGKVIEGGLKIASVGPVKDTVNVVETESKKLGAKEALADQKRLESLRQMKKGYQQQKLAIKSALLNIDLKSNNKITFGDDGEQIAKPSKKARHKDANNSFKKKQSGWSNQDKLMLFEDEENEDDNAQYNFEVKEHLEGKKGQKLMQLQSRFKNDKRFQMDARFLEEEPENEQAQTTEDQDDISQEQEKQKQFEILEEVLGKKVYRKPMDNDITEIKRPKMMLRFDPSQPEHSKYEIKEPPKPEKVKRKRKYSDRELEAKPIEEEPQPEVSKTTFYKVAVDLKDALHEKETFSLANMFSKDIPEDVEVEEESEQPQLSSKQKMLSHEQNPFKYDSSSDEEENVEKTKTKSDIVKQSAANALERARPARLWTESFFFKDDDYRLQEGYDFIKRLEGNVEDNFSQLRRNLKVIVKAKVKNNQRKNRPFKKKLGGKKRIRVKRAMKR